MPRIFKGSESTLRLLISKTGDYQALTEIKIKLYTTDIENAIEVIDGIEVDDNIATITLAPRAFMGMEDGLINYIIDGATEDDVFHTERQSNYMLKTLSYINEDGVATQTMTIDSNGEYRITPNDGLYVDISVNVPDLNGSYDEGFNVGYEQGKTDGVSEQKSKLETISITENGVYSNEDGYNHIEVNVPDLNGSYDEGYTDGVNEQMSKLESINITENGTYTKEDGYNFIEVNVADLNGSYDEGYTDGYEEGMEEGVNNAGGIIAETARVLEVTENGLYVSRYSEIPKPDVVTGVYPDGTEFYNYAELTYIVYNTGIKLSENTKVEIWYKPRDLGFISWGGIIGTIEDNTSNAFGLFTRVDKGFTGRIGNIESYYYPNDLNKWFHLELSFADGFVVDGVNYKTYPNNTGNLGRYIFINDYDTYANGYFGMIKIDDTIIIPTEEGFLNTNTGALLEVVQEGLHSFTNNTPQVPEGELYKTVNVNITPKINIAKEKITFAYSNCTEIPEWADWDGIIDMENMFNNSYNLKTLPLFDTSMVTNMRSAFNYSKITELPLFNTSNVISMKNMFYGCSDLISVPHFDTSKVTDMSNMFSDCKNITTLPPFNTSKVKTIQSFISGCRILESLPALDCSSIDDSYNSADFSGYSDITTLTDVGGFLNLKRSITSSSWNRCPNLTYESCINILNGLYDFVGNGETPTSSQGKLKVHQNFLNLVGDEISIGINKGWTITA